MSDSLSGYSLRRGYSPHRNSSRRRSSKSSAQYKQNLSNETQEETDSIHVATYNDNPKHLYGLCFIRYQCIIILIVLIKLYMSPFQFPYHFCMAKSMLSVNFCIFLQHFK